MIDQSNKSNLLVESLSGWDKACLTESMCEWGEHYPEDGQSKLNEDTPIILFPAILLISFGNSIR